MALTIKRILFILFLTLNSSKMVYSQEVLAIFPSGIEDSISFNGTQLTGKYSSYLACVFSDSTYTFHFQAWPISRMENGLDTKLDNIYLAMVQNDLRDKVAEFSEPLLEITLVLMSYKENLILEDLDELLISTARDSNSAKYLTGLGFNIDPVDSYASAILKTKNRRSDVALVPKEVLELMPQHYSKNLHISNWKKQHVGIYVPMANKNRTQLLSILNEKIRGCQ